MKHPVCVFSLLSLLLLVIIAGVLQQPLNAQAAYGGPAHITATKQQGKSTSSGNMLYHSGPVMAGTTNATRFFGSPLARM